MNALGLGVGLLPAVHETGAGQRLVVSVVQAAPRRQQEDRHLETAARPRRPPAEVSYLALLDPFLVSFVETGTFLRPRRRQVLQRRQLEETLHGRRLQPERAEPGTRGQEPRAGLHPLPPLRRQQPLRQHERRPLHGLLPQRRVQPLVQVRRLQRHGTDGQRGGDHTPLPFLGATVDLFIFGIRFAGAVVERVHPLLLGHRLSRVVHLVMTSLCSSLAIDPGYSSIVGVARRRRSFSTLQLPVIKRSSPDTCEPCVGRRWTL